MYSQRHIDRQDIHAVGGVEGDPDVPIIDGVLPVYGVPESELSDYLRPGGLFLFIHHNIR